MNPTTPIARELVILFPLAPMVIWTLTYLGCRILANHPEPVDEPDAKTKISYASLVDRRFIFTSWLSATLFASVLLWLPLAHWPLWISYGSIVLVLIACDARTTWLPIGLTRICYLAMTISTLIGALLAVVMPSQSEISALSLTLGAILGALAAGGMFWLIWRFVGQLGFGDVRLALMTGGISGALGFDSWLLALFFGTLTAAIWGLVTMFHRKIKPSPLGKAFPYGPGLWLGPYLGVGFWMLIG